MLSRFSLVLFFHLSALIPSCGATSEDLLSEMESISARMLAAQSLRLEEASCMSDMGASQSCVFAISESALRAYVLMEKYVGGVSPDEVSSLDLLNTLLCLGDEAYDEVRSMASAAEIMDLRARLQSTYKVYDPDVVLAVREVTCARYYFARESTHITDPVAYALGFAHRTLALFLGDILDEGLFPGETGIVGRSYFTPRQQSSVFLAAAPGQLLSIVRSEWSE
ncbi:MAG: hypothetical protein LCH26_00680 [Proteobacteria bacterium]|nr:hypothetical protein [Pseudomonadota bacterium]